MDLHEKIRAEYDSYGGFADVTQLLSVVKTRLCKYLTLLHQMVMGIENSVELTPLSARGSRLLPIFERAVEATKHIFFASLPTIDQTEGRVSLF